MQAEFSRYRGYVLAGPETLDNRSPQFLRISSHSSFWHVQLLPAECALRKCLNPGVHSTNSNLEFTFPISLMLRAQPAKDEQGAAVWNSPRLLVDLQWLSGMFEMVHVYPLPVKLNSLQLSEACPT